jgi:hypothetical protein
MAAIRAAPAAAPGRSRQTARNRCLKQRRRGPAADDAQEPGHPRRSLPHRGTSDSPLSTAGLAQLAHCGSEAAARRRQPRPRRAHSTRRRSAARRRFVVRRSDRRRRCRSSAAVVEAFGAVSAFGHVSGSGPAAVRRALDARHGDHAGGDQVPLTAVPAGGGGGRGGRHGWGPSSTVLIFVGVIVGSSSQVVSAVGKGCGRFSTSRNGTVRRPAPGPRSGSSPVASTLRRCSPQGAP